MTRLRLCLGLLVSTAVGAFVVLAVRRARRRLVPGWDGLEALLADVVLVLSVLTVVADLVGAVGWFTNLRFAALLVVVAALVWWWGDASRARGDATRSEEIESEPATEDLAVGDPTTRPRPVRWKPYFVAVITAAIAAEWCGQLSRSYRHGMFNYDSLWYHLPMAANFVRSASFMTLKLYDADIVVSTYPGGSEVFHAIGMLAVGSDLLSPLLNIGWAALLLLAAHVIGRQYRCPHLAVASVLPVLALPIVLQVEALSALTEMMGLACLVAAIAFMLQGELTGVDGGAQGSGRLLLVGLSLGLVASTKFVMVGPVVVVALWCLLLEARRGGHRLRASAGLVVGATCVTGAFWYVRNIVRFGSPIPALHIGVAGLQLPHVNVDGTVGPMLPTVVRHFSDPVIQNGLRAGLGAFWPFILLVPPLVALLMGWRVAVRRRLDQRAVLGGVAFVVFISGLLTPQYLWNGVYQTFYSNVRYLLPGILLSSLAFALVAGTREVMRDRALIAFGLLSAVMCIATQRHVLIDTWIGQFVVAPQWGWIAVLTVLAVLMTWITINVRRIDLVRNLSASAGAALVIGALLIFQSTYVQNRYRVLGGDSTPYAWAQTHGGRRIGIEPYDFADVVADGARELHDGKRLLLFAYPFYGRDGSNRVEPIVSFDGTRTVRAQSCAAWWADVRRLRSTEVLFWDSGRGEPSKYERWTARSPTARIIRRLPLGPPNPSSLVLYRVDSSSASPC